uniref:Uncharacterized protein n=1 Tax=Lutzomyia longipalpis TaxID=7200 RepID=A0A1B0CV12_LUTLO
MINTLALIATPTIWVDAIAIFRALLRDVTLKIKGKQRNKTTIRRYIKIMESEEMIKKLLALQKKKILNKQLELYSSSLKEAFQTRKFSSAKMQGFLAIVEELKSDYLKNREIIFASVANNAEEFENETKDDERFQFTVQFSLLDDPLALSSTIP